MVLIRLIALGACVALSISAQPQHELTVEVRDCWRGIELSARVEVESLGTPKGRNVQATVNQAHFDLAAGRYKVDVYSVGHLREQRTIDIKKATTFRVCLVVAPIEGLQRDTAFVTGKVLIGGIPPRYQSVTVRLRKQYSDDELVAPIDRAGLFEIKALPTGIYSAIVIRDGVALAEKELIASAFTKKQLVFEIER